MDAALLDGDPSHKRRAALAAVQEKWLVIEDGGDEADSQGP